MYQTIVLPYGAMELLEDLGQYGPEGLPIASIPIEVVGPLQANALVVIVQDQVLLTQYDPRLQITA